MSIEQIQDPECPTELWWQLAMRFPLEAQASLLYPLLTLEEPGRWQEMEEAEVGNWVDEMVQRLSVNQQHLFAADCTEHVLPYFEEHFPKDQRPREAIRIRRLLVRGKATQAQWDAASLAAHKASMAMSMKQYAGASYVAAAASETRWAPSYASDARGSEFLEERRWQWARLQAYLRGEVQQVGAKRDESKALAKVDIAKDTKRNKDAQELRRDLEPYFAQMGMLAEDLSEDYGSLQEPYSKAYRGWQPTPEIRAWWARWSPPMNEESGDADRRRMEAADKKLWEMNESLGLTAKLIRFFTLLSQMLHSIPARPTLTAYATAYAKLASYFMPNGMYPQNSLVQLPQNIGLFKPAAGVYLQELFRQVSKDLNVIGKREDVTLDELRETLHPTKGWLGRRLVSIAKELSRSKQLAEDVLLNAAPKKGSK